MSILSKLGITKEEEINSLSILGECKVADIINGPEILNINKTEVDGSVSIVRLDNKTRLAIANGIKKIKNENNMGDEKDETLSEFVLRAVIQMSIKDYNELESLRSQAADLGV